MRDNSSLDKIFEYFSSSSSEKRRDMASTQMLPSDVLRAIVATYPASRSTDERAGSLPGERRAHHTLTDRRNSHSRSSKILEQFDLNADGAIHFQEFILLLTLLSISSSNVETVFAIVDQDGSGAVDAKEFTSVLRLLQERHSPQTRHSQSEAASDDDQKNHLNVKPSGLLLSFFGKNQKGTLTVKEFKSFLDNVHKEVVRLEFEHYLPDERNTIPGIDFARSLAASCHTIHAEALLDRIESLDKRLLQAPVSFSDFESAYKLQAQVEKLVVAFDFLRQLGRPVTREELKRVCKRVACVDLSPLVLDIIMAVFQIESPSGGQDPSGSVHLDAFLLVEALSRKARYNLFKSSKSGVSSNASSASSSLSSWPANLSSWWSKWQK